MSKLSKFLRSDTGSTVAGLALGYAKKQSADVRKVAPIIELAVAVNQAKQQPSEPLAGTSFGQAKTFENFSISGAKMPQQIQQIEPVKAAKDTTTFKVATAAAIITPFLPALYNILETWVGTLPEGSILAIIMPGVLAIFYGFLRTMQKNNERDNTAAIAQAQAATNIAQASAPVESASMPLAPVESVSLTDLEEIEAAPSE